MVNPPRLGNRWRILPFAAPLLVLAYAVLAWTLEVGLVDDTYIFLRYAQNIADGHGAVFNVGDRVEGYTSPLWLGILSLLARLPVTLERAAFLASGLAGALTLLWLVRREGQWAGVIGAAFLATHLPFVFWAWSGMDVVLAAPLVVATILAAEQRNYVATGLWYVLAILARPDPLWFVPQLAASFSGKTDEERRVAKAGGRPLRSP